MVCTNCLADSERCNACETVVNLKRHAAEKNTVSKFAAFFTTKKVKAADTLGIRTPDKFGSHLDAPMSGGAKLFGFLRRGSNTSRNISSALDEAATVSSPMLERSVARAATGTPVTTMAPPRVLINEDGSSETSKRLQVEVEKLKRLNQKLEEENENIKIQLERATHAPSNGSLTSSNGSSNELKEAHDRVADYQVQLQEAQDSILRLNAEILREREEKREYQVMNEQLQFQLQSSQPGGPKARSAIPPFVPLPNTQESKAWLEQIRNGSYVDYWMSEEANKALTPKFTIPQTTGGASNVPAAAAPPAIGLNGKKRSEIPTPPPLPKGLAPAAGLDPKLLGQGRRGSAPAMLETGPHVNKKESVFAAAGASSKTELKPLFWTVLDQNKVQGTIFEKITDAAPVQPAAIDRQLKALATRFAKRNAKRTEAGKGSEAGGAAVQAPRLAIMDAKRKQQIGIGLSGSFRNVSLLDLKKAIVAMDPKILTFDRVKMLTEMIPTTEEITQLDGFRSGGLLDAAFFAGMSKEETFFTDMAAIPRLKQRLLCAWLEATFDQDVSQVEEDLDNFALAIKTVRDSSRWKEFLALCLETGNYLNDGNNGLGGAWGFSLKEGLKKFSEMKSCENNSRFSLMHWIAEVVAAHKADLLKMSEEFGPVSDASTRSVEELKFEVNSIKKQIDIVRGEVEKCKLESSEGATKLLARMVPFLENSLTVQYARLQTKIEQIDKDSLALVAMHGENPQTTTCQQLFHFILEGVSAFLKCHEENITQKNAELKQEQQLQKMAGKQSKTADSSVNPQQQMKRDQSLRGAVKDAPSIQARLELEAAMAKRRRPQQQ